MEFKPKCLPTAIGSLPHIKSSEACQIVFRNLKEIPVWPQLPQKSYLENMYAQCSEGMPGVVLDLEKKSIFFASQEEEIVDEISVFYENYLKDEIDKFAISEKYADGFHSFLGLLSNLAEKPLVIKGQVVGPISFGLTVTDEKKKPIIYNEMLFDTIIKTLAMKARWQEKKFKEVFSDVPVIVFFDEPYLMSFGSAFVSLGKEQVIKALAEAISACSDFTGVHCCGKTDWTLFTEAGFDIISFDAYDYTESLTLYPREIKSFLERGGVLAWGIVPSFLPAIEIENVDSLTEKFEEKLNLFIERGIDKEVLLENALITPSCGTASIPIKLAEKAYELTKAVSERIREKYFGV